MLDINLTLILEKALRAIEKYNLCNHCLGRLFARLGYGMENKERGLSIKNILFMTLHSQLVENEETLKYIIKLAESGHEPSIKYLREFHNIDIKTRECYICRNNIFNKIDSLSRKVIDTLKSIDVEFKTYHVGTKIPKDYLMRELEVSTSIGSEWSESIKRELNRIIGKIIKNYIGDYKEFSRLNPDIEIIVDVINEDVSIDIKPLYLYTRYRKIIRGVSQVQLKLNVITSLQKILNEHICNILNSDEVIVHASGREDVDVRMLGKGRPMVMMICRPKKRPDIEKLRSILSIDNEPIELLLEYLKYSEKKDIRKLKSEATRHVKIYRALIYLSSDVSDEQLRSLEAYFHNRQIIQYTPKRIKRKSPRKKRIRMVYEVRAFKICEKVVELFIKCQGGLYVKELITGDEGRTSPNISDVLGVNAIPVLLDVLDVLDF